MHILSKVGRFGAMATLLAGTSAWAADEPIEEVVVTGSYIKGTPEDAELPVDVLRREDLQDVGSPTIQEMVRNLTIASGNLGQTNQFQTNGGQGNEGVATINLRGLGASRTLVLLNGRRHVATETQGVDINAMPAFAIGRIEMLKDGAAALYGSDAIGGVVNFITREDLEGFEIGGSYQHIEDGGDWDLDAAWGATGDNWNFLAAVSYAEKKEIPFRKRDWAVLPFSQNTQGGWSSISNPANILFPGVGVIPDPRCQDLGAFRDSAGSCGFQFTNFDNLLEKTEETKLFSSFNYDLTENATLHVEALYAKVELPEWKTSPSYAPQSLFGIDRIALADHPGLVQLRADYPNLPQTGPAFPINRGLGASGKFGEPEVGSRETETRRLSVALEGSFSNEVDYNVSVSWSDRVRKLEGDDMIIENMGFAMRGFGGPNCDRAAAIANNTPGQNGCLYYNPFSNAVERSAINGFVNPDFNPALANTRELVDWLFTETGSEATNELLVFEAIFSGMTGIELAGGNVGWAFGAQTRRERYELDLWDIANRELNPCPWTDPLAITLGFTPSLSCDPQTGRLAFLAASDEEYTSRRVYGVFTEFNIPVTDRFNIQAAVRFEDYGGQVGSTIDPKFAFSWNATDNLTVRGSASTTFRGPPQSFLGGTGTSLQFNAAANAFKAVDNVGNPNLKPESAVTTNLGLIWQNEVFYASIDYWRYDFSDPLQVESATQVVNAYLGQQCFDGGAGVGTDSCTALRSHVFPTGASQAQLQRTVVNFINGSDIVTSGIDASVSYDLDLAGSTLTFGADATYTIEYDSDDFVDIGGALLAPGGDFAGFLNDGNNPFQSLPDFKASIYAKYVMGEHRFNLVARYITDYKDADTTVSPTSLRKIDDQLTFDAHYNTTIMENLFLSFSVVNIFDEDPPQTATDLNYDPYTHNPYGRTFKLGLRYNFGGN
ncbi:MAG: TonB-dependent receptor [Pseudomonadales bacterium]|nr:TonB-dependent receptor [Pseudomonadales bacterium]MCP5184953.1 TonB-dependent receptor [Pseudomonadales bacterium]